MYCPSPVEQLAIQARLNFMLGPRDYDCWFLGFQCATIQGNTARVLVRSQDSAAQVGLHYATHVAIAIESVLKRPIRSVNVLPRRFCGSQTEQGDLKE
jgi:hypothetical protein